MNELGRAFQKLSMESIVWTCMKMSESALFLAVKDVGRVYTRIFKSNRDLFTRPSLLI